MSAFTIARYTGKDKHSWAYYIGMIVTLKLTVKHLLHTSDVEVYVPR